MIQEKIDEILDKRLGRGEYRGHGRRDLVQRRMAYLLKVKDILRGYGALRENILYQIDSGSGEYHAMALENPEFADAVRAASPDDCLLATDGALAELDLLDKRFGRDTINISVIGRARQGKSRLLQTISGLCDEVIPAANGSDCTGAKSVICNSPGMSRARASVTFYTEYELVQQVQRYLDELHIAVTLGAVSHIPALSGHMDAFRANMANKSGREQSLFGHLAKYVEHFDEYSCLLGGSVEVDEDEIRGYVAQYDAANHATYKFLAVKEVRIFTEFNYAEAGKIVLVDTIGLGDTSLGIREKMIFTLRNDSDAAILVRLPAANGDGIRVEDDELYDFISDTMGADMLSRWLFFALNVGAGLDNHASGQAMAAALRARRLNYAGIIDVDCASTDDVQHKLLLPVLEYLTANLDTVDEGLMAHANAALLTAYMKYFELCGKASSALCGGLRAALNAGGLFDELFEDRLGLKRELNRLNQRYIDSNRESNEIRDEILKITRRLADLCPDEDEIKQRITEGGAESHVDTAYNFYADNMRAAIRDTFDEVNHTVIGRLEESVKAAIIEALRSDNGGRLGRVPLMGDTETPEAWLKALIEQTTDDFPAVRAALEGVLNYRLNIEGLLEYKYNTALQYLDQESPRFTRLPAAVFGATPDEQANIINQTLLSAIPDVAHDLMDGISELLLIPTSSFNALIRKLRERLVFRQSGHRELKNFYREHAPAIWSEEFGLISRKQTALQGWNEQLDLLQEHNRKDRFVITVTH